jgi:uncharacterized protein YyaL (SSP411 family)
MAAALSAYTAGLSQIVIVEGRGDPAAGASPPADHDALDRALALHYLPFSVQLHVTSEGQRALAGSLPFLSAMTPVGGATAAYVCRDFTCRPPVTTVDALEQELGTTA